MTTPDAERVHPETVEEWRAWLDQHHASSPGVWQVSWKKHTGRSTVAYDEAVTEALAVGWVDSRGQRLDDDRTMLWFTRRRTTSGWSRPNKIRVERLLAEGRMGPAGWAAIGAAKENGTWSLLDDVEALLVPDDLSAAFDLHPGAREHWEGSPARPSAASWSGSSPRSGRTHAEPASPRPPRRPVTASGLTRGDAQEVERRQSCAPRTTRSWRSELPLVSLAKSTATIVIAAATAT